MPKVRARVVVSGKVQGVCFRVETKEQAVALCVSGWVRNRPDGSVEGVFEGERENVHELINWCRQGPPFAEVTGVKTESGEYKGEYANFRIIF